MAIQFVPLLRIQRELQGLPKGMDRFQEYLRLMTYENQKDVDLGPMVLFNPMGKDHVTHLLDQFLALDADGIAQKALAQSASVWKHIKRDFRAALVVCDDLKGGWTNRFATEHTLRFLMNPEGKRFWITGVLWSSETASAVKIKEAILTSAFRTAYQLEHGVAQDLGQMMAQEGYAMARAGCMLPQFNEEEIAYSREVIGPFLGVTDMPRVVQCLFGDSAGETLGFAPMGLSPSAGLGVALHDANQLKISGYRKSSGIT